MEGWGGYELALEVPAVSAAQVGGSDAAEVRLPARSLVALKRSGG
jgi:hypothetical protein